MLVVTAAVFAPTLGASWAWDDDLLVHHNSLTGSLGNLPAMFATDLWGSTPGGTPGFYRPLMTLGLAIDQALGGAAWTAHLHSLLWHLLAAGLLMRLLRSMGLDARAAAAGGALWALHPVQVEAVAFVSSRNDPMAAALLLLGLVLLLRPKIDRRTHLLAGAALLGAALSKESALVAPGLLLLLRWGRGDAREPARYAAPLGALAVYVLLRAGAGVELPQTGRLLDVAEASLAFYGGELLWPADIAPGFHLGWQPVPGPAGALAVAGVLALCGLAGGRRALAGIALALGGLLPALGGVALVGLPAHRYLYLPLAGIALAVGAALRRAPALSLPVLGGAVLLGVTRVPPTLGPWSDDLTLWTNAARVHPNPYTWGSLGRVQDHAGLLDAAAENYARAVDSPRPLAEACYSVAAIHLKRGDPASAARVGLAALEGCEPSPELVSPTVVGLAVTGDWRRAEELASLVERDPTGRVPVVRVAAAARRGDLAPLRSLAREEPDRPIKELARQVAWILEQAGETEAALYVREETSSW